MNNDLIKRIAVCDMLHDEMGAWGNCADEIEALLKANDALWEIPAVDAVEVCRCKDCKWWDDSLCTNINGAFCVVENGDWFCASGERKGDDA